MFLCVSSIVPEVQADTGGKSQTFYTPPVFNATSKGHLVGNSPRCKKTKVTVLPGSRQFFLTFSANFRHPNAMTDRQTGTIVAAYKGKR